MRVLVPLDVYVLTELDLTIEKVIEYAKFINRELEYSMFEGDQAIFNPGKYNDIQPSLEWNYYSLNGYKIFQDCNIGQNKTRLYMKIKDIIFLKPELKI